MHHCLRSLLPSPLAAALRTAAPLLTAVLTAACNDDPTGGLVTSGTLAGVPFTVASGDVVQANDDGPLRADAAGAVILLDQTPAALGMTNPRRLHLLTLFALQHGGTLTIGAFGTASDPFGPGNAVVVGRNGSAFDYAFYVDSVALSDTTTSFAPPPVASDEQWLATEFYADSVPGYGAGSGLAVWQLNDLDPALGDDVLGCSEGPAMSTVPMTGDRVAFRLVSAFLVGVAVIDTIVGPCV